MELVVLAVDFVDLSPIKVKQQGLEISKNVFSLSKIMILAKSAFKDWSWKYVKREIKSIFLIWNVWLFFSFVFSQ